MPGSKSGLRWKKSVVRGIRMKCIACEQVRWCHPRVEMCGTCTFGEADAEDEFAEACEEWTGVYPGEPGYETARRQLPKELRDSPPETIQ